MKILNSIKIENLKLKINSRGEIATVLTLISVGLMLAGILAGTKIAQVSTEQRTQAQNAKVRAQSSTLSGCQIVDTDNGPGCWCAKPDPGVWQFHCFSGATRGTPASTACTNNCTALNTGGGGDGGAGDGTGTPTDGKNCNLNSTYLTDSVGDCGTCILDTAGNRDFFSGFPCTDGQKASYWCNGGVSGGTKPEEGQSCQNYKTQCISAKKCTGKPITSPSPTGTDGKGGGGGEGTPGPGGGGTPPASAAKPGGYLIVNAGGRIKTSTELNPNPTTIDFAPQNWSKGHFPNQNDYGVLPFPTGYTLGQLNQVNYYQYDLPDRKDKPFILNLDGNIDSPINVNILNHNTNKSIATAENYTVCYFPTPKLTPPGTYDAIEPSIVPTIVQFCKSKNLINQIDIDLTNVTPVPTTAPTPLTFEIKMIYEPGDARLFAQLYSDNTYTKQGIFLMGSSDTANYDKDLLPSQYNSMISMSIGSLRIESIPITNEVKSIKINLYAKLFLLKPPPTPIGEYDDLNVPCDPLSQPIILTKDQSATNDLGDLVNINISSRIVDGKNKYSCALSPYSVTNDKFRGSANVDFDNTMAKWKSGEIDATKMSSFISQLTRTPGLQVTFCDPLKGECNL